jgi:hypothetical protein
MQFDFVQLAKTEEKISDGVGCLLVVNGERFMATEDTDRLKEEIGIDAIFQIVEGSEEESVRAFGNEQVPTAFILHHLNDPLKTTGSLRDMFADTAPILAILNNEEEREIYALLEKGVSILWYEQSQYDLSRLSKTVKFLIKNGGTYLSKIPPTLHLSHPYKSPLELTSRKGIALKERVQRWVMARAITAWMNEGEDRMTQEPHSSLIKTLDLDLDSLIARLSLLDETIVRSIVENKQQALALSHQKDSLSNAFLDIEADIKKLLIKEYNHNRVKEQAVRTEKTDQANKLLASLQSACGPKTFLRYLDLYKKALDAISEKILETKINNDREIDLAKRALITLATKKRSTSDDLAKCWNAIGAIAQIQLNGLVLEATASVIDNIHHLLNYSYTCSLQTVHILDKVKQMILKDTDVASDILPILALVGSIRFDLARMDTEKAIGNRLSQWGPSVFIDETKIVSHMTQIFSPIVDEMLTRARDSLVNID